MGEWRYSSTAIDFGKNFFLGVFKEVKDYAKEKRNTDPDE
jgi:hypothetical protein